MTYLIATLLNIFVEYPSSRLVSVFLRRSSLSSIRNESSSPSYPSTPNEPGQTRYQTSSGSGTGRRSSSTTNYNDRSISTSSKRQYEMKI